MFVPFALGTYAAFSAQSDYYLVKCAFLAFSKSGAIEKKTGGLEWGIPKLCGKRKTWATYHLSL